MVFKRLLILISIILIVALLGACVRSASTPPAEPLMPPESESAQETTGDTTSGATEGEAPVKAPEGQPTNEVLQQLALFVTQTAAAAQLTGGQQPAEAVQAGTPYPPAEGAQPGSPPATSSDTTQPGAENPTAVTGSEAAPSTSSTTDQTQPGQPTSAQPAEAQQPGSQATTVPQPTEASQPVSPSTSPVVITPTPGIPKSYTLQSGEFPYCIARRFNVNPFELLSINGLTTSSIVLGGTTLKIPQTGHPFPGERSLKAHPTTYTVQGGENIYEIACSFGSVSPDMIALANGLKQPFTLTAGQTLQIP
jgi:LysM repeat protein